MITEFHNEKETDIELSGVKIPYYSIVLTPEQSEIVKNKSIELYQTYGITLFKIKDEQGKETGEYAFFVMFI